MIKHLVFAIALFGFGFVTPASAEDGGADDCADCDAKTVIDVEGLVGKVCRRNDPTCQAIGLDTLDVEEAPVNKVAAFAAAQALENTGRIGLLENRVDLLTCRELRADIAAGVDPGFKHAKDRQVWTKACQGLGIDLSVALSVAPTAPASAAPATPAPPAPRAASATPAPPAPRFGVGWYGMVRVETEAVDRAGYRRVGADGIEYPMLDPADTSTWGVGFGGELGIKNLGFDGDTGWSLGGAYAHTRYWDADGYGANAVELVVSRRIVPKWLDVEVAGLYRWEALPSPHKKQTGAYAASRAGVRAALDLTLVRDDESRWFFPHLRAGGGYSVSVTGNEDNAGHVFAGVGFEISKKSR